MAFTFVLAEFLLVFAAAVVLVAFELALLLFLPVDRIAALLTLLVVVLAYLPTSRSVFVYSRLDEFALTRFGTASAAPRPELRPSN